MSRPLKTGLFDILIVFNACYIKKQQQKGEKNLIPAREHPACMAYATTHNPGIICKGFIIYHVKAGEKKMTGEDSLYLKKG